MVLILTKNVTEMSKNDKFIDMLRLIQKKKYWGQLTIGDKAMQKMMSLSPLKTLDISQTF